MQGFYRRHSSGVRFIGHITLYDKDNKRERAQENDKDGSQGRSFMMKGYDTQIGYMGYVDGEYILFSSYSEYREYLED